MEQNDDRTVFWPQSDGVEFHEAVLKGDGFWSGVHDGESLHGLEVPGIDERIESVLLTKIRGSVARWDEIGGQKNKGGQAIWIARACPQLGHSVEGLLSGGRNQNALGGFRSLSEELILGDFRCRESEMYANRSQVHFANVPPLAAMHDGQGALLGRTVF